MFENIMNILVIDNGLGPFVDEQIKSILSIDKSIKITRYSFSGKNNKLNYIKAIIDINKILSKNKYDLVHAHYGLTGFISLFQNKCPVICTFHGSDVLYNKWQNIISRFTARHCAINIAVSDNIAKILKRINTYTIPCGVDDNLFYPTSKTSSKKRLGLDNNKIYILFPSSPNRKVKNYKLFNQVFERLKKEYNIEQLFLENLSRQKVRDYLNAVDFVLLTSFSESTNTTIKEALFCNTPVISVDVGDHMEILSKFSRNFVTSYNVDNIIKSAKWLLDNNNTWNFRKEMKYYKINNIAKIILNIYKKIYNNR